MLSHLKALNPDVPFYSVHDPCFSKYGKIVNTIDFAPCLAIMEEREIPPSGNRYVPNDEDMAGTHTASELALRLYGGSDIQIGYCNGNSSKLNALEYHKCSEINVAVTDLVLLLSDLRLIQHNTFSSSEIVAFYIPMGTACELYATTLHFAPCKVSDEGYKSIIVLTKGTNLPLPVVPSPLSEEDQLLWMQNKWLIAHPESAPAASGALVGITSANIQINY